ncbi:hypothetical protein HMSLTHF_24750 [Vreelandella aquamarina]|uniref:Uncharacterized protein n=1 Tax=Vreelandella aquamarina TaxID=77097 RepID=A0A6F8SXQ7_9GAMM|nr:hypothetical protein HMSLTHF_24750 [Halomonas meridiana]
MTSDELHSINSAAKNTFIRMQRSFFFWNRREVALKPRCDDAPQQAKYSLALISVTASADLWHTHPREALN